MLVPAGAIKIIMNFFITKNNKAQAYVTLITVIVTGAVILSIILFMINSGLDATENSMVLINSNQAKYLADACAEEALQQIRDNTNFVGTNSVVFGSSTCSYAVANTGTSTRTINASSTVLSETKKVRVYVNALSPKITLSSWSEVAD